jgi:hypothetical protein
MSNLTTLPKGDSAWLLRKAIQQVIEQVNTLEANVNPAATGGSLNTQVLFNDNGAVKGDTNLTFDKNTDTLTSINGQFTNINASGNVALGNLTVSGTFTALGGENASAVRAAASDYAAVAFDGATASTRISSACQAIGTGDFSMWIRFRVPTSFGSFPGLFWLTSSSTTNVQPNAFGIYIASAGSSLNVFRHGTIASTDNRQATVASFLTNFVGQVVDVVVTRAGNTLKIYINGTDTAYTETTGGAAPQWGQTVDSGFTLIGAGASSTVFTGRIYRSVVFNRALSASDVTELITLGVNPADQWGTQTATYTSDFSVNADNWSQNIGNALLTATGNIDGISGVNDTLRFANTDTVVLAFQVARSTTTVANKRFRLVFDYFAETGSGLQFLGIGTGGSRGDTGSSAVVENVWQTGVALEFVRASSALPISNFTTATGSVTANVFGVSKNVYFKNFVLTRIGAIVDLDFTVGTGYQATDRSTNALHGTLFNGVEFTQPKRVAVLYATTNTNGNQQMLGGTLAIPTNAIIEDIIVNSTGSATVSVGNASAGTQIVNGASVVSGRQKLTIATPFSTTGNLWVNSNAAATLQFTILYTIAS